MMCMAREIKSASGSAMSVVAIDRQSSFCRIGLCLVFHCDSILETSVQQRRQRLCPLGDGPLQNWIGHIFPENNRAEYKSSIN